MTVTEIIGGRPVEIETIELEPVRVRVLPNGDMDSNNAAKYVGRAPKTLAMWRIAGGTCAPSAPGERPVTSRA